MIVGIIGSKDQLVNEYRVILAEKLLSKTDYDIDPDIRTLELLKARFQIDCPHNLDCVFHIRHHHHLFSDVYALVTFWRGYHAKMRNHAQ